MNVKNATEFIIKCENLLGWCPPDDKPLWKARAIEAGKLNKKIKTDPKLYTWHNLELALSMSVAEREPITSPVALCWRVERALRKAEETASYTDPEFECQRAVEWELGQESSDERIYWVGRFTRVHGGTARRELLNEWKAAGRGSS